MTLEASSYGTPDGNFVIQIHNCLRVCLPIDSETLIINCTGHTHTNYTHILVRNPSLSYRCQLSRFTRLGA